MARPTTIDEYLATVKGEQRTTLEKVRRTIRAIVPKAEECISYGMPAFRVEGKVVAGFQATSNGCSYYPFSGTTLQTLADTIAGYDRTKSALHFAADKPLPRALVRTLLEARMAENQPRAKARARAAAGPKRSAAGAAKERKRPAAKKPRGER